ncbi:ATP-binding protein [Thermophilibacter sp. ZX-H3]|uniref:ATP-binding protein n=1 Tax=unclassified Thermophilibacter TaxID=2847308 RepID=UPI0040409036
MYEQLVAEYLAYELPTYVRRRDALGELPAPARRNIITTLIGVRRCGKTFRLFQLMDDLARSGVPRELMLYFPFDDDRLGELDELTASRVLDAYYALVPAAAQGCYLFFDEIQDIPNWASFARRVAEQNDVTLVLTGSSSKLLSLDIPTRLRGRSLATEVWPLDFAEFCSFHGWDALPSGQIFTTRDAAALSQAFLSYLDIGGFPAVQGMTPIDRVRLLQAYADEIVTKDVLERFGNASFRAGRRLALAALRSTGLKFSVNKQVNAMRSAGVSISSESAYALLDDFQDAHLAFKLADYSRSIADNPKAAYKLYSVDQGLSLAVAPASHVDLGQRLETAVFMGLKRRHAGDRDRVIARYSSPACPEVDFVVGDALLAAEYELVQVAVESGATRPGEGGARSTKYRSEVGNLERAMAETNLSTSTLVTLDEEDEVSTPGGTVRVVPAWKWFLEK